MHTYMTAVNPSVPKKYLLYRRLGLGTHSVENAESVIYTGGLCRWGKYWLMVVAYLVVKGTMETLPPTQMGMGSFIALNNHGIFLFCWYGYLMRDCWNSMAKILSTTPPGTVAVVVGTYQVGCYPFSLFLLLLLLLLYLASAINLFVCHKWWHYGWGLKAAAWVNHLYFVGYLFFENSDWPYFNMGFWYCVSHKNWKKKLAVLKPLVFCLPPSLVYCFFTLSEVPQVVSLS